MHENCTHGMSHECHGQGFGSSRASAHETSWAARAHRGAHSLPAANAGVTGSRTRSTYRRRKSKGHCSNDEIDDGLSLSLWFHSSTRPSSVTLTPPLSLSRPSVLSRPLAHDDIQQCRGRVRQQAYKNTVGSETTRMSVLNVPSDPNCLRVVLYGRSVWIQPVPYCGLAKVDTPGYLVSAVALVTSLRRLRSLLERSLRARLTDRTVSLRECALWNMRYLD